MSARAYNWLFALWLVIAIVRSMTGASDAAVIGSLVIAIICSATADILAALSPAPSTPKRADT